ncbi:MAG: helix-turn-helix transcriptional regulator [Spirochaetales bacterium]|nr:helix-turn-helix transcriptional regulator [Spirochaetales bacterium]
MHDLSTRLVFRTLGQDPTAGLVGCGIIQKTSTRDSHQDARFPHFGIIWLIEGRGTFVDSTGSIIPLKPGSAFLRVPGERHSSLVFPDGQWIELFVAFGAPIYRGLVALGRIPENLRVWNPGLNEALISRWVSMIDTLDRSDESTHDQVFLGLQALSLELIHQERNPKITLEVPEQRNPHIKAPPDKVVAAQQAIESDHLVPPEAIAQNLGIRYSLLRKQFRDRTGLSMKTYQIHARIRRAQNLLIYSPQSVTEIAKTLGYLDSSSFVHQFRQIVGTSPKAYRIVPHRS